MGLKEITARLLNFENHGESKRGAEELHAFFSSIVKLSSDLQSADHKQTLLSEGKALSPHDAARCIFDYTRTRGFLGGVRAALIEARRRFPRETIHILYAGCGPFAPLAIPLTTEFTADEVQFTLLDIHGRSLDVARQIVETLGLAAYVRDYVQGDATSYTHPREDAPHIILTEMMQKVLEKEPHVVITGHLAPQLREGGIFVPQKITLTACLADLSAEFVMLAADDSRALRDEPRRKRIDLGTVFELTAESSVEISKWTRQSGQGGSRRSPAVKLNVPQLACENYQLMILTHVTVFGPVSLGDYECALTYPTVLDELGNIRNGQQLEFHYLTGEKPGLRYRLLEDD